MLARWFESVMVVFAVARVVRIIAVDEIFRPVRQWFAQRLPEGSLLVYLVFCRWCLSVWVSVPVASLWWAISAAPRCSGRWWFDVPVLALALSYACGLLIRAEPEG